MISSDQQKLRFANQLAQKPHLMTAGTVPINLDLFVAVRTLFFLFVNRIVYDNAKYYLLLFTFGTDSEEYILR